MADCDSVTVMLAVGVAVLLLYVWSSGSGCNHYEGFKPVTPQLKASIDKVRRDKALQHKVRARSSDLVFAADDNDLDF